MRTASLRILVVLSGVMSPDSVGQLLTEAVIKKLFEHMIVDKAINKQLSLQAIVNTL